MATDQVRESTAIVTGLGMASFALFLGVSLHTHSPSDLMDYQAAASLEIQNKAGLFGAYLAHHALCLYGVGSWVLAVLTLVFGALMCALKSMEGFFARALGGILLTAMVCTWYGALENGHSLSASYPAGAGGLLGSAYLAPALVGMFGKVGVFLVLGSAGLLACLLLEQTITEGFLGLIGRGVVSSASVLGDLIVGRMKDEAPLRGMGGMARQGKEPVLAAAGASGFETGDTLARIDVLPPPPAMRKGAALRPAVPEIPMRDTPAPLPGVRESDIELDADDDEPEAPARREKPTKAEKPAKQQRLEFDEEPAPPKKQKAEPPLSDAEESERRRQEAMRQAEAAENDRLDRERVAKETVSRKKQRRSRNLRRSAPRRTARRPSSKRSSPPPSPPPRAMPAVMTPPPVTVPRQPMTASNPILSPKPKELPVNYILPSYSLLIDHDITPAVTSDTLKHRGATLVQTLWDFQDRRALGWHSERPDRDHVTN